MDRIELFSYINRDTPIHRIDERVKLALLLLLSLSILRASIIPLSILSLLYIYILYITNITIIRILSQLRVLLLLFLLIFLTKAYQAPTVTFIIPLPTLSGVRVGGFFIWRFFLVFLTGLIFISTTRISRINGAIYSILSHFPLIKGGRVSMIITLTINFIPVIFRKYSEIVDSLNSRGLETRKNPIYRIKSVTIPLLINMFEYANETAEAMESRGYHDIFTPPDFRLKLSDFFLLCLVGAFFVFLYFF